MPTEMRTPQKYIAKSLLRPTAKPLPLRIAPPLIALWSLRSLLFAVLIAIQPGGDRIIGSQPVTHLQYVTLFFPWVLLGDGVAIAAAYGFYAERPWARRLWLKGGIAALAGPLLTGTLAGANLFLLVSDSVPGILLFALTLAYLYPDPRAGAYFRALEREGEGPRRGILR